MSEKVLQENPTYFAFVCKLPVAAGSLRAAHLPTKLGRGQRTTGVGPPGPESLHNTPPSTEPTGPAPRPPDVDLTGPP